MHPADSSRLRELRLDQGWTQQEVAERVERLAWSRREQVGINQDMVAKWERGARGVSARYRRMLAAVFQVSVEQLGLPPTTKVEAKRPKRDENTLIAMLDSAADLLSQLGGSGQAVRANVLAAMTDEALDRRSLLAMLDAPKPRPPADPTELDAAAQQYAAVHATANPAALMTALTAHLRMVGEAVALPRSAGMRQRLYANRARVAILAGRIAATDLGNPSAARAYYSLAYDDAQETGDHPAAAVAHGYTAQLAAAAGQHTAALDHLRSAAGLAPSDPTLTSWLAATEATVHAAAGNPAAAADALDRAGVALADASDPPAVRWFTDHDSASIAASAGRVLLHAEDWTAARDQLAAAADQLGHHGVTARRALVLCLLDLATAEVHAGSPDEATRTALRAVDQLHRLPFAAGTAALNAVRDLLAEHRPDGNALRALDEQMAEMPRTS